MLGHECIFPNSHFRDSVVRNNKRSSGTEGRTSDWLKETIELSDLIYKKKVTAEAKIKID